MDTEWTTQARLGLAGIDPAHHDLLGPAFDIDWHAILPDDLLRKGAAWLAAGTLESVDVLVPAGGQGLGLRGVVATRRGAHAVRLQLASDSPPRWRCGCVPRANPSCLHAGTLAAFVLHHQLARLRLPGSWRIWYDHGVTARVERLRLRNSGQAKLRLVIAPAGDAGEDPVPSLWIRPEVLLPSGEAVDIHSNNRTARGTRDAAIDRLTEADQALLRHIQLLHPLSGRAAGWFAVGDSDTATGVVTELLANHELHWRSASRPPLAVGADRAAHLRWKADANGAQRMVLLVAPSGTRLFRAGHLLFLEPDNRTIGRVSGDAASYLQAVAAPPVAVEDLGVVRRAWPVLRPHANSPAPRELSPTAPLQVRPTLSICLDGVILGGQRYLVALPRLRYGPHTVAPDDADEPVRCDGSLLIPIRRDRAAEAMLLAGLDRHGLVAPDTSLRGGALSLRRRPTESDTLRKELLALAPRLEEAGISVEVGAEFGISRIDATDAELVRRIVPHPTDKSAVQLHVEIEIGDQRLPLLPLLLAALKDPARPLEPAADPQGEEDQSRLWEGGLDDGTRIRIPIARLRALAEPVIDWLPVDRGWKDSSISLPKTRAIALLADPEAAIEGRTLLERHAERLADMSDVRIGDLPELPRGLKPFQIPAVQRLNAHDLAQVGSVLGDPPGAGKTVMVIAHHLWRKRHGRHNGPTLVCAPSTPLCAWREALPVFAPAERVVDLSGPNRADRLVDAGSADVVLVSYEVLRRDIAHLRKIPFGLRVLDEAQYAKTEDTAIADAIDRLNAQRTIVCTASLAENSVTEYRTTFHFAVPGLFGSPTAFARQFARPIEEDGDQATVARLRALALPFLIRRTKQELMPDLPRLHSSTLRLPIPDALADFYATLHARLSQEARDHGLVANAAILALLADAQLAAAHPVLAKAPPAGTDRLSPSPKFTAAIDLIQRAMAMNEAVLVFSRFVLVLDLFAEHLAVAGIGALRIQGDTTDRGDVVNAFQQGTVPTMLLSQRAGNAGITLTRANHVIELDQWWNPAVSEQSVARAWRLTQTREVHATNLVLAGSIDERVSAIQARKSSLTDALYGHRPLSAHLTGRDVERLFGAGDGRLDSLS